MANVDVYTNTYTRWIASKNSGIRQDVYECLRAHKRGDGSVSETLDRILREIESDWRTNAGFLSGEEGRIGASTVVLSELYRGLLIGQDMTSKEAMSKCEWVEPVPFTNEAATEAAELRVELGADGGMIDESDVYIAGTARSPGASLVVGTDHFGAVDGLTVETYRT